VKKFAMILLICVFTVLIIGSVQSSSADHSKSNGKGIFT
ncbi:uncharacterized protein METZ01_LOCUS240778, partial [marine metagenome]